MQTIVPLFGHENLDLLTSQEKFHSSKIVAMEDQILKEIKELRLLLSKIIGTSELPAKERFSKESISKAAAEFKKLSIKRGEWITQDEISKIIKKAPYNCGKFIIDKFGFTNYFLKGRSLYFKREDIIALNNELKRRNINLEKYIELVGDQEKFIKRVASINDTKGKKSRQPFIIPDELRDINTAPYHHPSREVIKKHIETLQEEFKIFKMAEYIDVHNGNYAMFKYIYYFDRYVDEGIKKRCKNWCSQFNYANNALKEINKIKSQTIYE